MWKKSLIILTTLILSITTFGFWFMSQIPGSEERKELKFTQAEDLDYLKNGIKESRGKILAVVTSSATMGSSNKKTGYELTELARAYYVFSANGFEVEIASPEGGTPPIVIDGDDMGKFDYAFLNDPVAQSKVNNSIHLDTVEAAEYEAVFFVGGKGAMFDFPDNPSIQNIVRQLVTIGGVIGAVCHGPAALVNVTLDDGTMLVANKTVSSFTNEEELFLIPDANNIFPFLLEDKLVSQGAVFNPGPRYLEQVSQDGKLVTGQNPWSVWKLAETMVLQLGYEPIPRVITAEENSINILYAYETSGFQAALTILQNMVSDQSLSVDRTLIAMHSIVALMDWQFAKTFGLLRILKQANNTKVTFLEMNDEGLGFAYPIA